MINYEKKYHDFYEKKYHDLIDLVDKVYVFLGNGIDLRYHVEGFGDIKVEEGWDRVIIAREMLKEGFSKNYDYENKKD